ncbi:unnamed protein product [Trichobilharzia szidati]|nr:unnamed protein product [Trichobilharzia szidati]
MPGTTKTFSQILYFVSNRYRGLDTGDSDFSRLVCACEGYSDVFKATFLLGVYHNVSRHHSISCICIRDENSVEYYHRSYNALDYSHFVVCGLRHCDRIY